MPALPGAAPEPEVRARRDVSHLEIEFLLAWAEFLASVPEPGEWLHAAAPFAGGSPAPLANHLSAALRRVREDINAGPHGLVRMLAGDGGPCVDAIGVEGIGESVLNTAKLCHACFTLAEVLRAGGDPGRSEMFDGCGRVAREAVTDCFDGTCFVRAYTDTGRPVGGSEDHDRVYTDVQAWAVVARCGTTDSRNAALDAVSAAAGDGPIPLFSPPYMTAPATDVSRCRLPPAHGENGGISLKTSAELLRALALEGRIPEALRRWEYLTIRRRATEYPAFGTPIAAALDTFCAPGAGILAGGPGFDHALPMAILPRLGAMLWQEWALRAILSP